MIGYRSTRRFRELQNAFNGLPNLNLESYVETNDAQLVTYLGLP